MASFPSLPPLIPLPPLVLQSPFFCRGFFSADEEKKAVGGVPLFPLLPAPSGGGGGGRRRLPPRKPTNLFLPGFSRRNGWGKGGRRGRRGARGKEEGRGIGRATSFREKGRLGLAHSLGGERRRRRRRRTLVPRPSLLRGHKVVLFLLLQRTNGAGLARPKRGGRRGRALKCTSLPPSPPRL